jgi:hypothetical protein
MRSVILCRSPRARGGRSNGVFQLFRPSFARAIRVTETHAESETDSVVGHSNSEISFLPELRPAIFVEE